MSAEAGLDHIPSAEALDLESDRYLEMVLVRFCSLLELLGGEMGSGSGEIDLFIQSKLLVADRGQFNMFLADTSFS